MDREQAQRECERLRREHPERAIHTWIARDAATGWEIVRVPLPAGIRRDPLRATVEAKPQPRDPADPRPGIFRDVPPYGAG